jgi:hypothetical protein
MNNMLSGVGVVLKKSELSYLYAVGAPWLDLKITTRNDKIILSLLVLFSDIQATRLKIRLSIQ